MYAARRASDCRRRRRRSRTIASRPARRRRRLRSSSGRRRDRRRRSHGRRRGRGPDRRRRPRDTRAARQSDALIVRRSRRSTRARSSCSRAAARSPMRGLGRSGAAILMAWYPGQDGGNAIAEVAVRRREPVRQAAVSLPRSDATAAAVRPRSDEVEYDYFHGYRYVDPHGLEPQLSVRLRPRVHDILDYGPDPGSRLARGATAPCAPGRGDQSRRAQARRDRTALRRAPGSSVERAVRELASFARVSLDPGQTESVALEFPVKDLAYWDEAVRLGGRADQLHARCRSLVESLPATATFEIVR